MALNPQLGAIIGSPVQTSPAQQRLMQQLNAAGVGLFGGGGGGTVDPNDPESLAREAQRLSDAGDQAGALKLAAAARQAAAAQRQQQAAVVAEKQRTADATKERLNEAGRRIDEGGQELQQMRSKQAAISALEEKGFMQEAELVRSGVLTPEKGVAALAEARRDATSAQAEQRRSKLKSVQSARKAMDEVDTKKKEINANFQLLKNANPERYQAMVKQFGQLASDATPEEVKVLHALTSRAGFMGGDVAGDGFEWKPSNATQRKIAYEQYNDRLNDMVGANDMAEDTWGTSNDTSGYSLLLAETINSIKNAQDISDAEAAELVMAQMEELAATDTVNTVVDMAQALDDAFRATAVADSDADLLNKYGVN